MPTLETLTIINRPELDPVTNKPRWNLTAREIGGTLLLPELPEGVYRQDVVLQALGNGISAPKAIAEYARRFYRVAVEDPQDDVNEAKKRYRAATTFEALSLAMADGSVPIDERPPITVSEDVAVFLGCLTNGSTPKAAAAANGVNVGDEQQVWEYRKYVCEQFGVKSLYEALRLAHEHGIVRGRTPLQLERRTVTGRFIASNQVGFALSSKKTEAGLTLPELRIARACAAGLHRAAIAYKCGIAFNMLKDHMKSIYAKLEAHNVAEAVTKLVVLGLAEPAIRPPRVTDNINAEEISVVTMVAQGFENAEIGSSLGMSKSAVKTCLHELSEKLGNADRRAAVLGMFELGIFKVEETANLPM